MTKFPSIRALAGAITLVWAATNAVTALATPVRVAIDTSSLGVSDGFLELQLSATVGANPVTTQISNFSGFGVSDIETGDSWGYSLSGGGYTLSNETPNDVLHAVHFGSTLSFYLDVDGLADAGYVTHFTASLWDPQFNALGDASSLNDSVLDLGWIVDTSMPSAGRLNTSYASELVSVSAASPVPEPNSAALVLAALGALCLRMRRRVS